MDKFFEIVFLDEAFEFLKNLDRKHSEKILYNIRKSQLENNPELFKKLSDDIWEFRTNIGGFNIDYWPFGIRLHHMLPWWLQRMDLLKKGAKFQIMNFKKR